MEFPDLLGREACTTKGALVLNQMLDASLTKDMAAGDGMGDVHAIGVAFQTDITG